MAASATTPPTPAPAATSRMTSELALVTREQARLSVERLKSGYRDKSGSFYGPTLTNEAGCILAQKVPNRAGNGYVRITPLALKPKARVRKCDPKRVKPLPQGAHRLVVIAYKNENDVSRLLADEQASHLCHQPTCVNEAHIIVEPKDRNEAQGVQISWAHHQDCVGWSGDSVAAE